MPSLKERAKTLIELIDGSYFIFADRPLEIEPKAAALLTPENRELIGRLRAALEAVDAVDGGRPRKPRCGPSPNQNSLKLGAVAQPLRVALTGRTTSPGIFDVLAVLGRQECLARLADQAPPEVASQPRMRHLAAHTAIRYPFNRCFWNTRLATPSSSKWRAQPPAFATISSGTSRWTQHPTPKPQR